MGLSKTRINWQKKDVLNTLKREWKTFTLKECKVFSQRHQTKTEREGAAWGKVPVVRSWEPQNTFTKAFRVYPIFVYFELSRTICTLYKKFSVKQSTMLMREKPNADGSMQPTNDTHTSQTKLPRVTRYMYTERAPRNMSHSEHLFQKHIPQVCSPHPDNTPI